MANQSETTMTLTDTPDDDERAVIMDGLRAYNQAQAGDWDGRPLAVLTRDLEKKKVAGGLLGRTSLGLLTVERFFLPEALRRNRLGSQILAMAEEEARRRGCTRGVLSTLHFQAQGFYVKQGWNPGNIGRIGTSPWRNPSSQAGSVTAASPTRSARPCYRRAAAPL